MRGALSCSHNAASMGYDTVVIFGAPFNYVSSGFVSCKKHNVCVEGDKFPSAMLIRGLKPGALDGRKWYYKDSPVMAVLPEDANAYDDTLMPKERTHTYTGRILYHEALFCGMIGNGIVLTNYLMEKKR